jgi:DNA-binding SARP family transcriptional activator/tetratricopeptide (TPR) repeat protein
MAGIQHRLARPRICGFGQLRLLDERALPMAGRPGRVLAALLVQTDGIAIDRLIDAVWPTHPPADARSALHVTVSRLRRVLEQQAPGLAIERSGDAYRLRRDGWEIDLDLVLALAAEATAIRHDDPSAAAHLVDTALGMWTDEPLVIDGEPFSAPFAARYEVARLDLEETQVEILRDAGRFVEAEASARCLVDAEPYRERRWVQLMQIQAAQGRLADALATYQLVRRRLADDLGIEPGAELQHLERSLLTRRPVLHEQPETLLPPPTTVGPLVGRTRLLERAETALALGIPVVVLGAPGVGKTRFAIELARRGETDGRTVGWIDLRNARFDDPDLGGRIVAWGRAHPSALVALDNVESAPRLAIDTIASLRRAAPTVAVVATSRIPIDVDSCVVVLNPLEVPHATDPDEVERSPSVRLLRSMFGLLAPSTPISTEVAAELSRRTGGLPIGIKLSAELARTTPLSDIADRVAQSLSSTMDGALATVLGFMPEEDREAFADVCEVAGPLDAALIGALTGRPAGDVVDVLLHHGLLQYDPTVADAPYSMLEPLRDAMHTHRDRADRLIAHDRLADHCLDLARALAPSGAATSSGERLPVVLGRQLPWHRQALAHLVDIGDADRALRLAAALEHPLYGLGWWSTRTEIEDLALAIPSPPSSRRARVLAARGRPGLLHEMQETHLLAAIDLAAEVDDLFTAARARYQLGLWRWWEGKHGEALELFACAEELGRRGGDRFAVHEARRFAGVVRVCAGDVDDGLAAQLEVLAMLEHSGGATLLIPHVRMYIGHCRRHVGDDESAVADLDRARAEYEQVENRASLVHVLAGLAELHADAGRGDSALEHAGRGLEVARLGGMTVYDPWLWCIVARVHAARGDREPAIAAAMSAAIALEREWEGETHRVAAELAAVMCQLEEPRVAARLAAVAAHWPDRRELPFRSPAETHRFAMVGSVARRDQQPARACSVTEALAPLSLGASDPLRAS